MKAVLSLGASEATYAPPKLDCSQPFVSFMVSDFKVTLITLSTGVAAWLFNLFSIV